MSDNKGISQSGLKTVIAKALSDPAFKARLLTNANETLASLGAEIPSGTTVKFVENTASVTHFVIPAAGSIGELTGEILAEVAGGVYAGAFPIKDPIRKGAL